MHPQILLVNGPPRAGKDTVGNIIFEVLNRHPLPMPPTGKARRYAVATAKFAGVLKSRTHAAYGLYADDDRTFPPDWFEDRKDEPLPEFLGLSPRQAYIAMSERYFKPTHGEGVFGELLLGEVQQYMAKGNVMGYERPVVVITDSGFVEEAGVFIDHFGGENCALLRVHRDGHSFAGDSRSYLDLRPRGCRLVDLPPCKDLTELRNATLLALRQLEFDLEGLT